MGLRFKKGLKKSVKEIVTFCLLLFVLCGCASNQDSEKQGYVDVDEKMKTIQEGRLDIKVEDFTYDDKPWNVMRGNYTVDDKYLYMGDLKLDLKTGRVQHICQIPGCPHDEYSPCLVFSNPVATSDGIYHTDGNKLLLYHDDIDDVILENGYYTDYEKEFYPDNKDLIVSLTVCGDVLYAIGPSYFFTYNMKTKEATEPQKLCDDFVMSAAVTDGYFYFTTVSMGLYKYDINAKTFEQICEKAVGKIYARDGRLYYIQSELKEDEDLLVLYSCNADGTGQKRLIEDCFDYAVNGEYVYYQSSYENKNIYVSKLDGSDKRQIEFEYEDIEFEYENYSFLIISSNVVGNVFMSYRDWEKGIHLMFVFEAGETDYKVVSYGDVVTR